LMLLLLPIVLSVFRGRPPEVITRNLWLC